ncbi:transmembrane protease serine 9 [Aplysia californica]|uniref:Transmembrane protease serine 9 n=1 Tax=Aplysia californica TaxID=6500 RepID=A0ABM0K2J1_APLCA|nr:transmembrane protease serine 9 [Aplysia californica]
MGTSFQILVAFAVALCAASLARAQTVTIGQGSCSSIPFGRTTDCPISSAQPGMTLTATVVGGLYSAYCIQGLTYSIVQSGGQYRLRVSYPCGATFRIDSVGNAAAQPTTTAATTAATTTAPGVLNTPQWGAWSQFGSCSASCGGGLRSRSRTCSTGRNADCESLTSFAVDRQDCNTQACPPATTPVNPNNAQCGQANSFRIIGGTQSGQCEFPWMVMVYNRMEGTVCGGSILDQTTILTAAHCVVNKNAMVLFSSCLDNDVAILKLSQPLTFDQCQRPVCLTNSSSVPQRTSGCKTMGWGIDSNSQNARVQQNMFWASVPVVSDSQCGRVYGFQRLNQVFCAGGNGEDACQGDSGGPLVCQEADGRYYQYGIVSAGVRNNCGNYPGLYTRVSNYIPWIESHRN